MSGPLCYVDGIIIQVNKGGNMGMPFIIDNLALTLGRFIRKADQQRNDTEDRVRKHVPARGAPTLITLSSGQMLLPGIGVTHRFMR